MDGHRGEDLCRAAGHRFIERPTPLLRRRVVSSMDVECDVVCVAACVLHRGLHDFGRQLRREAFSFRKNRRFRPLDKVLWRRHGFGTSLERGREDALQNELLCLRFRAPFREGGHLEGQYPIRLQLSLARVIRPAVYQGVSGRAMMVSCVIRPSKRGPRQSHFHSREPFPRFSTLPSARSFCRTSSSMRFSSSTHISRYVFGARCSRPTSVRRSLTECLYLHTSRSHSPLVNRCTLLSPRSHFLPSQLSNMCLCAAVLPMRQS